MYSKVKFSSFERFIELSRILLSALDRIVPAAEIVARGRMLTTNQRAQLEDDFVLMHAAKKR